MFDFVKNIDYTLIRIITDVENNIKVRNGYTMVAIQSYCEMLLKYINSKENIIKSSKLSLGDFLNNDTFMMIIEKDLNSESLQLSRINNISNDIKHEGKNGFDKKEVEKSYRFIYSLSVKVNNYYCSDKVEQAYDQNRFESLLNEYEEEKKQIIKQIEESKLKSDELINERLSDAISQKEVLEKRIFQYESEKSDYLTQLKKLDELEIELRKKDLSLQNLRDSKAELEKQLNEENNSKKEEYENKIRNLKSETRKLQEQIDELRSKDTIDKIEKIDRDKKILSEKEIEIEELKSLLDKKAIVEDEELYNLYRKTSLQIGFSSSYVDDDSYFTINGVYPKSSSTSKYKSFYAILNNLLQRGRVVSQGSILRQKNLTDKDLKEIFRLQMCILSLLRNNRLNDKYWKINYINGNIDNLRLAIDDIVEWIQLIISLTKLKYEKPDVDIKCDDFDDEYVNIKYDNKLDLSKNIYTICDQVIAEDEDTDDYFSIWIDDYVSYNISSSNKNKLIDFMYLVFGFKEFNDGQYEILEHTMNGNNTIGILPTGGGKSLIYQLSSLLEPKMTLVVDPINSLIKDQIDGLRKKFGITRCLNITSSNDQRQKDEAKLRKANAIFVFTSPERFQNEIFRKILLNLSDNHSVERIVLDEVHCLSEWGHDFRIPYLMLAETLITYCGKNVKYLGLTATAAANVIRDLIVELKMSEDDVVYLKKLRRKNLTFHIDRYRDRETFKRALSDRIEEINPELNGENTNSIIVFARTKNGKDPTCIINIMGYLNPLYGDIIERYDGDHKESQDAFINNEKSLLVATKAFGMGIDKPNIRSTIHFGIPSSFENFYQEAGRAGRDRKPADCYLYTYDTPSYLESYVNDFFDPNTSVRQLKYIQEKTSGQLDLSSNFWFLTNDLETPEDETRRSLEIFDYMKKNLKGNIIYLSDDSTWHYEKYLYILHKIGIVLNWEKNYSSYSYSIYLSSYYNDIEHIKNEAKKYVSQYKDNTDIYEKIDAIVSINELNKLLLYIREWYYNKFALGRREQLANMYEKVNTFANRNCSDEIQSVIDSYFDLTNIIVKSEEGYALTFDDDSIADVIRYATELDANKLSKRCIEMERVLESNTNNNINLYTSLIFLRNNNFNSRNGNQRFEALYKNVDSTEQEEIYENIAKLYYKNLSDDNKNELIDFLYNLDPKMLRSVFLENVDEDEITRKYWIPFINMQLKNIIKGGK